MDSDRNSAVSIDHYFVIIIHDRLTKNPFVERLFCRRAWPLTHDNTLRYPECLMGVFSRCLTAVHACYYKGIIRYYSFYHSETRWTSISHCNCKPPWDCEMWEYILKQAQPIISLVIVENALGLSYREGCIREGWTWLSNYLSDQFHDIIIHEGLFV